MEKICYKFQGRSVHVVAVKWLPAFTLKCLYNRRLETKGLLVSPPPPLPPDRFFLFNQRVKRETRGKKKIGRRAKWWGRVESQKLQYRKSFLGVRAAESLQQGREASKTLAVISTQPASLFSSLRASGSFGFPLPPSDHIHYFPQDNTIKLVFTDILSSQPV